jgi:hypothetical protein
VELCCKPDRLLIGSRMLMRSSQMLGIMEIHRIIEFQKRASLNRDLFLLAQPLEIERIDP